MTPPPSPRDVRACREVIDCLIPMGMTSENVAEKYGLTRRDLDTFTAKSYQRAAEAQRAGKFDDEIVPVMILRDGASASSLVTRDDGIRPDTTPEKWAKLCRVFKKGG